MSSILRQNCQPMGSGRCSDHDVCKPWGQALVACEIGQPSGNASGRDVESEYSIAVEMEHSLELRVHRVREAPVQ